MGGGGGGVLQSGGLVEGDGSGCVPGRGEGEGEGGWCTTEWGIGGRGWEWVCPRVLGVRVRGGLVSPPFAESQVLKGFDTNFDYITFA